MRDFLKIFILGIVLVVSQTVFAEDFKLLVLPDNIITQNSAIDSYIYNSTSEFFADEIVTLLDKTEFIKCEYPDKVRGILERDIYTKNMAKNLLARFRTTYNIDYGAVKKIADRTGNRYVLLLTSFIDSENYILRRTLWDFLNIPGATVTDPAYKISTYAVLIDTKVSQKIWADTYYKTISVCENRIITRGASPQTEQLQKIRDYSRYLCPQIAQQVQINILPANVLSQEKTKIDYNIGNIDNVFTKKYRHIGKELTKLKEEKKQNYKEFKIKRAEKKRLKELEKQQKLENENINQTQPVTKLEVKAVPLDKEKDVNINKINNKIQPTVNSEKDAVYRVKNEDNQHNYGILNTDKKNGVNNLYGKSFDTKPKLREYSF